MLMNQNSRYKNAVGKPSIASKLANDEIPKVSSMRGKSRSINVRDISVAKSSPKNLANRVTVPRGPRSMGSAAGYRGEKKAFLEVNGSGYAASSRKIYPKAKINNVRGAVLESNPFRHKFSERVTGRLAENSIKRMKNLKSLSRLV